MIFQRVPGLSFNYFHHQLFPMTCVRCLPSPPVIHYFRLNPGDNGFVFYYDYYLFGYRVSDSRPFVLRWIILRAPLNGRLTQILAAPPYIHPIIATLIFHGQTHTAAAVADVSINTIKKRYGVQLRWALARRYKVLLPPGYIMLGINC